MSNQQDRKTNRITSNKLDYIAVLDFEANCIPNLSRDPSWKDKFDFQNYNNFKNEIIEIPTVIMTKRRQKSKKTNVRPGEDVVKEKDSSNNNNISCVTDDDFIIVDEFRSFIKPTLFPNISDFCTALTGITQDQVDTPPLGGRQFAPVWKDWLQFMSQYTPNCLIVTCGDWDLRHMLPQQLEYCNITYPTGILLSRWCNIKVCFEELYGVKGRSMVHMLQYLNLSLDGRHHSGIDDCRNIAKVVQRMLIDGKKRGHVDEDTIYTTAMKSLSKKEKKRKNQSLR